MKIEHLRVHSRGYIGVAAVVFTLAAMAAPLSVRGQDASADAVAVHPEAALGGSQPLVPQTIRYTGLAANRKGDTVEVTFRLYAEAAGGEPIWQETQTVAVGADGRYTALLGSQSDEGLPQRLFAVGQGRWISVSIERAPETTRSLLASVAYAMKAADAETLAGQAAANFVTQAQLAARLEAAAQSLSAQAASQSGLHPETTTPTGSGIVGTVPLWMTSSSLGSSAVVQIGSGAGAWIGIGTIAPATRLDVNGVTTLRNNLLLPAVSVANAAAGASSPLHVQSASSYNSSTAKAVSNLFAWQAQPVGNDTANPSASLSLLSGPAAASLTATGLSIAPNGIVTFPNQQTFPGTGTLTGLTAGTGLLGGGATGAVSLKIDPSVVAQLGAANTFAGTQTVNGDLLVNGSGVVSGNQTVFGIGAIQTNNAQGAFYVNNTSPQAGAGVLATAYNAVMGFGNYQGIYGISSAINYGLGPYPSGVFGQGLTGVYGMGTYYGVISNASGANGVGLSSTGASFGVNAGATGAGGTGVQGVGSTGVSGVGGAVGVNAATPATSGIGVNANASGNGGIGVQTFGNAEGLSASSSAAGGIGAVGQASGASSFGVFGTSPGTGVLGLGAVGVLAVGSSIGSNNRSSAGGSIGTQSVSPYIGVYANSTGAGGYGVLAIGNTTSTSGVVGRMGANWSKSAAWMSYFAGSGVFADTTRVHGVSPALAATADDAGAGYFVNNSSSYATLGLGNLGSGGTLADSVGEKSAAMVPVLMTTGRNGHCMLTGDGDSVCTGTHKSAVSIESGARQVEVFGVQAAESWVEDFGSGALVDGHATVTLDATFAGTVNTEMKYHVYLTPRGECEGLYVAVTSSGSFEVRELHHGQSNVEFDYRIVARRRGNESDRLTDVTSQMEKLTEMPRKMIQNADRAAAAEPNLPAIEEPVMPTVLTPRKP